MYLRFARSCYLFCVHYFSAQPLILLNVLPDLCSLDDILRNCKFVFRLHPNVNLIICVQYTFTCSFIQRLMISGITSVVVQPYRKVSIIVRSGLSPGPVPNLPKPNRKPITYKASCNTDTVTRSMVLLFIKTPSSSGKFCAASSTKSKCRFPFKESLRN